MFEFEEKKMNERFLRMESFHQRAKIFLKNHKNIMESSFGTSLDKFEREIKSFVNNAKNNDSMAIYGDEPVGEIGTRWLIGAYGKEDLFILVGAMETYGKHNHFKRVTSPIPFNGSSFGGKGVRKPYALKLYTIGFDYIGN